MGGIKIGRVNRSAQRKPIPAPLCPPQIPHKLVWDRTQAAVDFSINLLQMTKGQKEVLLKQAKEIVLVFTVILRRCCAIFKKYSSKLPKLVVLQELEFWREL
jgi:hypothetical protein